MNVHLFQGWQSRTIEPRTLSAGLPAGAGASLRWRLSGLGKWWGVLSTAVRRALALRSEGESSYASLSWPNGRCRVPPRVWRRHSGYLVYCVGAARRHGSQ